MKLEAWIFPSRLKPPLDILYRYGQQIRNKVIFRVQLCILKAGHPEQELIEAQKLRILALPAAEFRIHNTPTASCSFVKDCTFIVKRLLRRFSSVLLTVLQIAEQSGRNYNLQNQLLEYQQLKDTFLLTDPL